MPMRIRPKASRFNRDCPLLTCDGHMNRSMPDVRGPGEQAAGFALQNHGARQQGSTLERPGLLP